MQSPPTFAVLTFPVGAFNGYVREFREKVAQLKDADGYTIAIGLDLMIVRVKGEGLNLQTVQPDCKFMVLANFKVRITGKMQGLKAINFYYRRKGENNYTFVGYLTNLPGELTIIPAAPNTPEVGDIRGIYVLENNEVGQFSTSTQLTLS